MDRVFSVPSPASICDYCMILVPIGIRDYAIVGEYHA